jgi:hypothetical protein
MNRDYLQDALQTFNSGNWYGWKKEDSDGNKIPNDQRMTYANIEVIKDGATIPGEADVNAKIQEIKDSETAKANNKTSAQNKLKALGLTDAEIEAL